jgi:hypothetical protein
MFQAPAFSFWNIAFTAIGASIFWGKWGRTRLRPYVLSDLIGFLTTNERWRGFLEFAVFLILGCIVGIGVVQPSTATQALTAGFGWTGLFARQK